MLSTIAIIRGFTQLVVLLAELAPIMLKLWRQWQQANGRLSATERKRLSNTVRAAVKNKDTGDLEAFLTQRSKASAEARQ